MNEPRPFESAPEKPLDRDRAPIFHVAASYYQQRHQIAGDSRVLNALIAAIDAESALTSTQWAQWYAVALGFQPDLIVELGRAKGNSTAAFCQAASRLGRTRIVSLCNSRDWVDKTLPRLRAVVTSRWLEPLDARITDILDVDYAAVVGGAQRVLVLWDAHGFEIAEIVLGRLLPLIADRPHLVLMHDISDNRYAAVPRSYEGQPLWKGSTWDQGTGRSTSRVNIGWMNSLQDQVIAIADFAVRNDIEILSADHEYAQFFGAHPDYAEHMRSLLGDRFFAPWAQWAFFTLTGKQPPFHFPALSRRFTHRSDVVIHDVHASRWRRRPHSLPRRIDIKPIPWAYASVMAVQPCREIPADVQRSLRIRLVVEDAPVGIGLLNADQSKFVENRRLLPGLAATTVFLPVADPANSGPLVLHAWDLPEAARVVIEDINLVW